MAIIPRSTRSPPPPAAALSSSLTSSSGLARAGPLDASEAAVYFRVASRLAASIAVSSPANSAASAFRRGRANGANATAALALVKALCVQYGRSLAPEEDGGVFTSENGWSSLI